MAPTSRSPSLRRSSSGRSAAWRDMWADASAHASLRGKLPAREEIGSVRPSRQTGCNPGLFEACATAFEVCAKSAIWSRAEGCLEVNKLKHRTGTAMVTATFLMSLAFIFGSLASAQVQPPIDLPPVPYTIESAIGVATNAGGTGIATFVFADGVEPWAALIVKAGTPDGIDSVTVTLSLETKTLSIQANDAEPSNVVTILVNKGFIDAHIAGAEGDPRILRELKATYPSKSLRP